MVLYFLIAFISIPVIKAHFTNREHLINLINTLNNAGENSLRTNVEDERNEQKLKEVLWLLKKNYDARQEHKKLENYKSPRLFYINNPEVLDDYQRYLKTRNYLHRVGETSSFSDIMQAIRRNILVNREENSLDNENSEPDVQNSNTILRNLDDNEELINNQDDYGKASILSRDALAKSSNPKYFEKIGKKKKIYQDYSQEKDIKAYIFKKDDENLKTQKYKKEYDNNFNSKEEDSKNLNKYEFKKEEDDGPNRYDYQKDEDLDPNDYNNDKKRGVKKYDSKNNDERDEEVGNIKKHDDEQDKEKDITKYDYKRNDDKIFNNYDDKNNEEKDIIKYNYKITEEKHINNYDDENVKKRNSFKYDYKKNDGKIFNRYDDKSNEEKDIIKYNYKKTEEKNLNNYDDENDNKRNSYKYDYKKNEDRDLNNNKFKRPEKPVNKYNFNNDEEKPNKYKNNYDDDRPVYNSNSYSYKKIKTNWDSYDDRPRNNYEGSRYKAKRQERNRSFAQGRTPIPFVGNRHIYEDKK